MKAVRLHSTGNLEESALKVEEVERPVPRNDEILLRVRTCGICHTDLHIVEGDLPLPKIPLTPGHQIVGIVEECGPGAGEFSRGDRLGVPWLYDVCGRCEFCRSGRENLCDNVRFTGYHVDGGYAEFALVRQGFAYRIPEEFNDLDAAPLLCAGVIGFRALRLSGIKPEEHLGLFGFGASAHIALQVARHWGCEVFVFTRSTIHQELARMLGAVWVGNADDAPPERVDSAVIFAPAGRLVPAALRVLKKGGTIALAGIHMSPIPEMEYSLLYEERTVRSVANSTRDDVRDLLKVAAAASVHTEVESFALEEAPIALRKLKNSELRASGALAVS
ncbi:MAG: zinc-dependent alcohol dehydrogenase family protein [Ignavibacteria bacterium]|nr:zinc-dependent alcohol dehydrogenase family protein [Ignavibacteria bacterium]